MYLHTIPFLRPCAFRLSPFGMKRLGKLIRFTVLLNEPPTLDGNGAIDQKMSETETAG